LAASSLIPGLLACLPDGQAQKNWDLLFSGNEKAKDLNWKKYLLLHVKLWIVVLVFCIYYQSL